MTEVVKVQVLLLMGMGAGIGAAGVIGGVWLSGAVAVSTYLVLILVCVLSLVVFMVLFNRMHERQMRELAMLDEQIRTGMDRLEGAMVRDAITQIYEDEDRVRLQ